MKHICDVCGFDTEAKAETGNWTEEACTVEIREIAHEYKRVKEMFGKTEFILCWCCYIKTLGVKPLEVNV